MAAALPMLTGTSSALVAFDRFMFVYISQFFIDFKRKLYILLNHSSDLALGLLFLSVLGAASSVNLRGKRRHERQDVFNQFLLVTFAQDVVDPFDGDTVAFEVVHEELEHEAAQSILVLNHDPVDLPAINQLEQLLQSWPLIGHARADFFEAGDDVIAFLDAVSKDATRLAFKIALLLLFMTGVAEVRGNANYT